MLATATLALAALFVLVPSGAGAEQVAGKITNVQGKVEIRRLGAVGGRVARRWATVFVGDIIETGADGRLRILLEDSSVVTLSEDSKLTVDEQVFNPDGGERSSFFSLLRGRVRAMVSKYINATDSRFEVRTPTAVAGVRGTDKEVTFNPSTGQTGLYLYEGSAQFTDKQSGESMLVQAGQFSMLVPGQGMSRGQFTPDMQREHNGAFEVSDPGAGAGDLPSENFDEGSEYVDPEVNDPETPGENPDQTTAGTGDGSESDTADDGGTGDGSAGGDDGTGLADSGDTDGSDDTIDSQTENTGTLPVDLEPPPAFSNVRVIIN